MPSHERTNHSCPALAFAMSTHPLRASKRAATVPETKLPRHISQLIVAFPTYQPLLEAILSIDGVSRYMSRGGISWKKFEDGFPNLMINDVEDFRSRDVVILVDFLNLENIFSQLAGMCFQCHLTLCFSN